MNSGNSRLSRHDWLVTGLDLLAEEGHQNLTVKRLTERLGVTKGSFYWHFESVKDLHEGIVQHWLENKVEAAGPAAASRGETKSGPEPLNLLSVIQERKLVRYEAAMRQWAQTSPSAMRGVQQADHFRRKTAHRMMLSAGLTPSDATLLGDILYVAWKGSAELGPKRRTSVMKKLVQMMSVWDRR